MREEMVGPYVIWPAKAGMDFPKQDGEIIFDVGQHLTSLELILTPDRASSSPTPKRFQVELHSPTGGASVHPQFGLANVTLVANAASEAMWVILDQLHQPLDPIILNPVLQGLKNKVISILSGEQMTAVLEALGKVRRGNLKIIHCPDPKKTFLSHMAHICSFNWSTADSEVNIEGCVRK